MLRTLGVISACALALVFCATGRSQDSSPSLGDLARQAQKDKANKPAPKVITNDDMSGGSGSISSAPGTGMNASGSKTSASGSSQTSEAGIAKLQEAVDHLESLDRATLAAEVLQGNKADFCGARAVGREDVHRQADICVSASRPDSTS